MPLATMIIMYTKLFEYKKGRNTWHKYGHTWKRTSLFQVKKDMLKATGKSTFVPYAFDDNINYAYQVIIDHKKSMMKARGKKYICTLCH